MRYACSYSVIYMLRKEAKVSHTHVYIVIITTLCPSQYRAITNLSFSLADKTTELVLCYSDIGEGHLCCLHQQRILGIGWWAFNNVISRRQAVLIRTLVVGCYGYRGGRSLTEVRQCCVHQLKTPFQFLFWSIRVTLRFHSVDALVATLCHW